MTPNPQKPHSNQNGAALITVLMIIAAISVVALGVTQSVTSATQRARALDAQAQIRLYAVSAEEVAKSRLLEILTPLEGRLNVDLPGFGEAQTIPVDGGVFEVSFRDATNCYDLNSVVLGIEGGELQVDPQGLSNFSIMLESTALQTTDSTTLGASLVDWLDADAIPQQGGAEDAFYIGATPSYLTSSQPLVSLKDLRGIQGFSAETVQALDGIACARPIHADAALHQINLNTIQVEQAGLLQLAFSGALELEEARRVIANRPLGGWPDPEAFLEEPAIKKIDPAMRKNERLTVTTSLIEVFTEVSYRGQVMKMRFLFETLPGKPIRTLQRQRVG
jgi:general secretion pathway protein K